MIRHAVDFLILGLILALGILGLVYFRFDVASQIAVAGILGVLYVFWGIFHHVHEKNLTSKVIWEYVAMAALVDFMLIVFLLRV